jgi:hypothetical protein
MIIRIRINKNSNFWKAIKRCRIEFIKLKKWMETKTRSMEKKSRGINIKKFIYIKKKDWRWSLLKK